MSSSSLALNLIDRAIQPPATLKHLEHTPFQPRCLTQQQQHPLGWTPRHPHSPTRADTTTRLRAATSVSAQPACFPVPAPSPCLPMPTPPPPRRCTGSCCVLCAVVHRGVHLLHRVHGSACLVSRFGPHRNDRRPGRQRHLLLDHPRRRVLPHLLRRLQQPALLEAGYELHPLHCQRVCRLGEGAAFAPSVMPVEACPALGHRGGPPTCWAPLAVPPRIQHVIPAESESVGRGPCCACSLCGTMLPSLLCVQGHCSMHACTVSPGFWLSTFDLALPSLNRCCMIIPRRSMFAMVWTTLLANQSGYPWGRRDADHIAIMSGLQLQLLCCNFTHRAGLPLSFATWRLYTGIQ